jgi:hypothetical protein
MLFPPKSKTSWESPAKDVGAAEMSTSADSATWPNTRSAEMAKATKTWHESNTSRKRRQFDSALTNKGPIRRDSGSDALENVTMARSFEQFFKLLVELVIELLLVVLVATRTLKIAMRKAGKWLESWSYHEKQSRSERQQEVDGLPRRLSKYRRHVWTKQRRISTVYVIQESRIHTTKIPDSAPTPMSSYERTPPSPKAPDSVRDKGFQKPVLQLTVSSRANKVDKLTQSFEKSSASVETLIQQPAGQSIDRNAKAQQSVNNLSIVRTNTPSDSRAGSKARSKPRSDMDGVCFYCFNQFPELPPHRFRNQCPWYQSHRSRGVCHLNTENKICLGPEKEGALVIPLQRGKPHGSQVLIKAAAARFDERLKKCLQKISPVAEVEAIEISY